MLQSLPRLLELSPVVQIDARSDETGTFSRRHLYAVSRLAPDEQAEVAVAVKAESLTAIDTEQLVAKHLARRTSRRGAPLTRVQFVVPHATIVLTRGTGRREGYAAKPLVIVRAK